MKKLLSTIILMTGLSGYANADEVKCLTDMAYMEAKTSMNYTTQGVKDVVDVMFVRLNSKHFPSSVCQNVYAKGQYPWAKSGVKNKDKVLYARIEKFARTEYAKKTMGQWQDGTRGAMFFNNHCGKPAKGTKFLFKRHGHCFFNKA